MHLIFRGFFLLIVEAFILFPFGAHGLFAPTFRDHL